MEWDNFTLPFSEGPTSLETHGSMVTNNIFKTNLQELMVAIECDNFTLIFFLKDLLRQKRMVYSQCEQYEPQHLCYGKRQKKETFKLRGFPSHIDFLINHHKILTWGRLKSNNIYAYVTTVTFHRIFWNIYLLISKTEQPDKT